MVKHSYALSESSYSDSLVSLRKKLHTFPFLENCFFIGSLRSSINTVLTPLPASAQITWAVCKDEESWC